MAYISLTDANAFLTSTEWAAATDDQKNYALEIGAKWIDAEFVCSFSSPVQDEIQESNALLGEMYIQGILFTPKEATVEDVTVKAGPVTVSESYKDVEQVIDPFAEIKFLLSSTDCSISSSLLVSRG